MVLLAALVAGSAIAGHDAISLKRKPKVGDVAEYSVNAQFDTDQGAIKFTEKQSEKVTDVKPDGDWVIEAASTNITVDIAGNQMNPDDNKATTEFLPNGRVKTITVDPPAEADVYRVANLTAFEAPDEPKNIGDEIAYTVPADKDHGTPAYKADYKVVSLEKVKDWDTVKLSFTIEETEGDQKSSSSGTLWLSTTDGSVVKSESNWKNVQPQGVPFPLTGKFTLERTK